MRTTLTLEPDVAQRLRSRIRAEGLTLKAAVNEALRAGLAAGERSRPARRFVVKPHHGGLMPGLDLDKISQILDEMETGQLGRRQRR